MKLEQIIDNVINSSAFTSIRADIFGYLLYLRSSPDSYPMTETDKQNYIQNSSINQEFFDSNIKKIVISLPPDEVARLIARLDSSTDAEYVINIIPISERAKILSEVSQLEPKVERFKVGQLNPSATTIDPPPIDYSKHLHTILLNIPISELSEISFEDYISSDLADALEGIPQDRKNMIFSLLSNEKRVEVLRHQNEKS
jgi:Mg/Co/Ni transporter MgtE